MGITKSESKYLNTAHLMDEALLALLVDKEFDYITIKDICKKAGVNRSTFYLHYESIMDLLKETIEYKNEKFWSYFDVKKIDVLTSSKDELVLINKTYLLPYLNYMKNNKLVLKVAFEKADLLDSKKMFLFLYNNFFSPIMSRFKINEEDKMYVISYFINGINAIVMEWVKKDCKESVDHIAELIISLVPLHNND